MPENKAAGIKFTVFLRKYFKEICVTLVCIFLANLLSLAFPWAIKVVLDSVLPNRDLRLLRLVIVALVAILVLRTALSFARKYLGNIIGEKMVCDLRQMVYWKTHRLSLNDIKQISPMQILSRITQDIENIRHFIILDAIEFIYALVSIGFILFVLGWINLRLTLVALCTMPFFIMSYTGLLPKLRGLLKELRETGGKVSSRISEVINGITIVKISTAEDFEKNYFLVLQKKLMQAAKKSHLLNVGLWSVVDFFTSLGLILVLWAGGIEVISGRMTFGELMAFYSYLAMFFTPLIRLAAVNSSYQEAAASLERLNDIAKKDEGIAEKENPLRVDKIEGLVEFRGVSFAYSDNNYILNNISFTVSPGEVVGIVGPSGAGKTSLISLLLRLYDVSKGGIYIDGKPLKDLSLKSYRRHLAVVMQDDFLFNGTIGENISYGLKDVSPERIVEAAKIAQAHDFVAGLKDGYKANIGERGLKLSCGQRQRIAIARSLLREPALLILDEATSSLDALTENLIQKSVGDYMRGKTMFVIAHRFSTVMAADKIIVLNNGEIVEMGKHEELIKKDGFYRNLYLEQFKEEDRAVSPV